MNEKPIVLLVGHCGPDAWALKSAVQSALPDADVRQVDDESSLTDMLGAASLLLVNRVLDGVFTAEGGIELIRSLAGTGDPPKMMLVSNYEDAQADAQAAGAHPGFGKTQLYDPATRDRLVQAIGA